MKNLTLALISILFALPIVACGSDDVAPTGGDGQQGNQGNQQEQQLPEEVQFAVSLGAGWNLGNSLDAHWKNPESGVYEANETCWDKNNKSTQKTFDAVKKAGFTSVRIPVTWLGHVGNAPEYRIEKAWLDRVAEVAGYAKKAGLKAIINIHHDGFGAETNPAKKDYFWLNLPAAAKDEALNTKIKQQLFMMWMQIANRFQSEGDWLIFETLNEIQDGKWGGGDNLTDNGAQYRVLNEWNQICVDAIRATGGNNETRYIGIPGYVCQPGLTVEHLKMPVDADGNPYKHIMVAVHMYDPWDYAGSGKWAEWGHTSNVPETKNGEAEYVGTLDALYNKFVKNGIPVYLGEYGCVHRNTTRDENFRKYYLEYTIKALRDHNIPFLFWDNGYNLAGDDAFGLIRHNDGKFIANGQEIVKLMVDTWNNSDPDYTLKSVWEKAPR